MAGLTLHWEALPTAVAAAFRSVSAALGDSDFYLAGGTALALQEGHRRSVDLDLFSPTFDQPEGLLRRLDPALPGLAVMATAPRTLDLIVSGVQVSFFGYAYPLLAPLLPAGAGLLPLASPDDIAVMKLAAVAGRGSRKDFVDLWLLVRRTRTLAEFIELYRQKFSTRDIGHVLRSLVFLDDADEEPELDLLIDLPWDEVKRDITLWVGDYVHRP